MSTGTMPSSRSYPAVLTWTHPEDRHTIQIEFSLLLQLQHLVARGVPAGLLLGSARRGLSGSVSAYLSVAETVDASVPVVLAAEQNRDAAGVWIADDSEKAVEDVVSASGHNL